MSLKDKNIVVTGGSRGLGLGLVEALVAHGARVTVIARDADPLESVHARLGVATISADEGVWLAPAWLEGREVIAVFADRADPKPSYVMWLEWHDGRISFIRDYKYVRYAIADAELVLAPDATPAGDGATN
jgi:RNA polymerase sigma-70 factor (ECF subfamily)